jgi:hypothetical protein
MIRAWLIKLLGGTVSDGLEERPRANRAKAKLQAIMYGEEKSTDTLNSSGMKFTIYSAVGGHIMETAYYNDTKDEYEYKLYMINEGDDFAKQVAQAVMMETMSH